MSNQKLVGLASIGAAWLLSLEKGLKLAIIVACVLSLLFVLIISYISGLVQPSGVPRAIEVEKTPVVVAATGIPRGQMVTAEKLKITRWPKDLVPEGAIGSIEEAQGRAAARPILAGELVREVKLAADGRGAGIAPSIPKGMRAYTIVTPKILSSVAEFVLPGNRVNILLSLEGTGQDDETGGSSTTTLLQSVEILAVYATVADNKNDPGDRTTVTLLVTPDQATKLDMGQNQGTIILSPRNPEDREEAPPQPPSLLKEPFLPLPRPRLWPGLRDAAGICDGPEDQRAKWRL